jgi:hypothetical protein
MCNNIKNGPSLPSESYGLRQGLAAISVSCCGTLKCNPFSFSMKTTRQMLTTSLPLAIFSDLLGIEGIVRGERVEFPCIKWCEVGSGRGSMPELSEVLEVEAACECDNAASDAVLFLIL